MHNVIIRFISSRSRFSDSYKSDYIAQRLSNYGPRTTHGPRDLPLWSLKNAEEKLKFKLIAYLTIAETLKSLEMIHGNCLSLSFHYKMALLTQFRFLMGLDRFFHEGLPFTWFDL